jgi:hypothetical protein
MMQFARIANGLRYDGINANIEFSVDVPDNGKTVLDHTAQYPWTAA